jgi:TonB family protein
MRMDATMTFGAPLEQDRFSKYFGYALLAHVVVVALVAFMPGEWLRQNDDTEANIMYISLGGSVGEDVTGLRSVAARPVQEATPEPVRPQFQAPAEKPVMAIPEKAPAKPAPPPPTKTPIQTTTERPSSRTPIRGAEVREGQARIDTRVATGADGLAVASGGTGGETNLSNFCCPFYIRDMSAAIKRNWKQHQGVAGTNVVRFTIERSGRITNIELLQPSGIYLLDRESREAVINAKLPPLPVQFKEPTLVIRLTFEYLR